MSSKQQTAHRQRSLGTVASVAGISLALVLGVLLVTGAKSSQTDPGGFALLSSTESGEPSAPATEEPTSTPTPSPTTTPIPVSGPIRMVQANIRSGMSAAKTTTDLNTVYATQPDFITMNEVAWRPDTTLVRPGYAIQRTPGQYTGANPVLWNTARWTALAQGTYQISNVRGKTKEQNVEWGIRYANWATLQSASGQVVSVISTHFAPKGPYTMNLTAPSIRKLGSLAATLNARGPRC